MASKSKTPKGFNRAENAERRMIARALRRDPTYWSPEDELRHSRLEGEYEARLVKQAEAAARRRQEARKALPRPIPAQTAGEPTVAPAARNRA